MMVSNETIANLGESSQGIVIGSYILIVLYIIAMGINYWMCVFIGKTHPKTATYQIHRIDCLVTCLSQIGTIAGILGSIDKHNIKLICTIATGLNVITCLQPIVSCLFLAIIPFLKKWTYLKNQRNPTDHLIMTYYSIASATLFLYIFVVAFINHHQQLHILYPHEYCLRSEIHADLTKMFFYFILPGIVAFFVTSFLNSNILLPYSTHENLKDIYSALFAQTSVKSSALTFFIIFIVVLSLLLTKWLKLSVKGLGLMYHSFMLPLLIAKGPCMEHWTYKTEVYNLQEAQHNLMVMQNRTPYLVENGEVHNGIETQKELSTNNLPLPPFNTAADVTQATAPFLPKSSSSSLTA